MDDLNNVDSAHILKVLAINICEFEPATITPHGLHIAKMGITDTIGVTIAGLQETCVQVLLKTPGVGDSIGPALIFGTNRRTSALDAAFLNGTASHALDFDDFSSVMGGHQSVPLVAPLFALSLIHI